MTEVRPTTFQREEGCGTTTVETTTYEQEKDEGAVQVCPSYHTASVVHLLPSGAELKRNHWYRYTIRDCTARTLLIQGLHSESCPSSLLPSGKPKSSFVAIIHVIRQCQCTTKANLQTAWYTYYSLLLETGGLSPSTDAGNLPGHTPALQNGGVASMKLTSVAWPLLSFGTVWHPRFDASQFKCDMEVNK